MEVLPFTIRNYFFSLFVKDAGKEVNYIRAPMTAVFLIDIIGNSVDCLRLLAPSQVLIGEPFSLTLRGQDRYGNISPELPRRLIFRMPSGRKEMTISADMKNLAGALEIPNFVIWEEGLFRIGVEDPDHGLSTESNPLRVLKKKSEQNLYWGLIHEHTEISDGVGSLDLYFTNLQYGSRLDFGATADHDHRWETSDEMWEMTREATRHYNEPGKFVTFLGYEWAEWRENGDGDRNVYYLDDDRPMYRSGDGEFDNPKKLFAALRKEKVLLIPHHTAYEGNFCDWKDHDPECERLVEIYSVWGNSEQAWTEGNPYPLRPLSWDSPEMIKAQGLDPGKIARQPCGEKEIGFVQHALTFGWRVGFTAGGDMHRSHPGDDVRRGYPPWDYKAGIVAVWAKELTREAIFKALYNRRCYATTSARLRLDYSLNGHPMGSEVYISDEPGLERARTIKVDVHGTSPIQLVELLRNNKVVYSIPGDKKKDVTFIWKDEAPFSTFSLKPTKWSKRPFIFYYVRVQQTDGEMAWASPIWVE
ncbi:MAG: DUF3604 domain-containing protein [Spirochaetes bacterium]|nr:DUF3604 domain-containing protein [Spirochaetota bacterium]